MSLFDILGKPKKERKLLVACKDCGQLLPMKNRNENYIFVNCCKRCCHEAYDNGYDEAKKEIKEREEEVEEGERVLKKLGLYYKELSEKEKNRLYSEVFKDILTDEQKEKLAKNS